MKFIVVTISVFLLTLSFVNYQQKESIDYLNMEGTRIVHSIADSVDTLSDKEIIELQDSTGVSIWFTRFFYKTVCYSGLCKMVKIWIFWDGVGNYMGYQLNRGDVLTKTDHTEFTALDYKKLDELLKDSTSVLRNLKQEDLVTPPENNSNSIEVDGYTGATKPALNQVVVKGAVYSCHTLWHTVYGNTHNEIVAVLDKKMDVDYLNKLLTNKNPNYQIWAIRYIAKHKVFQDIYDQKIIEKTTSDNQEISKAALTYFHSDKLKDFKVQKALVEKFPQWNSSKKTELLWWLFDIKSTELIQEQIIIQLINLFNNKHISVISLNLIYQLISKEQIDNNRIIRGEINKLKKDKDLYISNLTQNFLKNIN